MDGSGLFDIFIFLAAAVIAVPVAKRLGMGGVLGYLLAGIIIGPWGLKLVHDEKSTMHFSEFGVVLMLFLIGLELRPKLLWDMRKSIFGFGMLQMVLTSAVLFVPIFYVLRHSGVAVIIALTFALSSTAVAMQMLTERKLLKSSFGQASFSVLLMQDILIVPILALAEYLAPHQVAANNENGLLNAAKIIAVIAGIIFVGRFLLKYAFRYIAKTGLRETFTAFSLLIIVGIAMLMDMVGMSMALGTFIAGVLLAESEYRHEIEADIEPFKALLLGLFFISVGMNIDFGAIYLHPYKILLSVMAVVTLKALVLYFMAPLFKLKKNEKLIFAFSISQISEFGFVILTFCANQGLLEKLTGEILNAIIALSMLFTPLLMLFFNKVIEPKSEPVTKRDYDDISQENPVIIAGFGRFGQIVGRLLHAQGFRTTILDQDADHIEFMSKFGIKVFYGDASRLDLLQSAGADKAKLFVLAIDDIEGSIRTLEVVQKNFPNLKILARARNRDHAYRLINMGVTHIFRETLDSSLLMAEEALKSLGFHAYEAKKAAYKFKEHDTKYLNKMSKLAEGDMQSRINLTVKSRKELEKLFSEDEADYFAAKEGNWWLMR